MGPPERDPPAGTSEGFASRLSDLELSSPAAARPHEVK